MIAIVVHGGAWDIPDDMADAHRHGVQKALMVGSAVLSDGGSAVDAVEAAITILEDDETFDAGTGSFLNLAGEVELDASIMDGKSLKAGAVASVQNIKNPISLARKIMEESDHILLTGKGALRFAKEHGMKSCRQDDLITEREILRWREWQKKKDITVQEAFRKKKVPLDTVGAVALDKAGNIASGTSTGGTPNKFPGRVGDSPIIGAGTYAENSVGGVSSTGWGEALIKVVMAKSVLDFMERNGGNPLKAALEGVNMLERKVQGYGGVIAMNMEGEIGMAYNTPRMARGYITSEMNQPWVAV
ncbi:MAG: isoaspartyl peptidase/L-asparaginase [Bacteroidetes bacterium]|nr:isoaspartyl peptidase/L-asparaginase [Bacteroidota bacterium]MCW5894021.1 isoaspartyl peptidase/L-asparaginase [Bacteroidota bacterium]